MVSVSSNIDADADINLTLNYHQRNTHHSDWDMAGSPQTRTMNVTCSRFRTLIAQAEKLQSVLAVRVGNLAGTFLTVYHLSHRYARPGRATSCPRFTYTFVICPHF